MLRDAKCFKILKMVSSAQFLKLMYTFIDLLFLKK